MGIDFGPDWSGLDLPKIRLSDELAAGRNLDGRLEVFAIGDIGGHGTIWHIWQVTPGGGWSDWSLLGTSPAHPSFPHPLVTTPITVWRNNDGRLEVFAVGSDGYLWHIWQLAPNSGWSDWTSFDALVGQAYTIGKNLDGRLEIFLVGLDGILYHMNQSTAGSQQWSRGASLGLPPNVNQLFCVSVGRNGDGRLEVFAIGSDGALWHIWQNAANGFEWANWASLGMPGTLLTPFAVGTNQDGRLQVFVCGVIDNVSQLLTIEQITAGGAWSTWARFVNPSDFDLQADTPPLKVAVNQDGRLEVLIGTLNGEIWHKWQNVASSDDWSNWSKRALRPYNNRGLALKRNRDGRLEAFSIFVDGSLVHTWQTTPGRWN